MSIIHDALKKAEASKAASKPAGTPADPAAELLAKMAPVKKKNAASPRLIVLLSTLFLAERVTTTTGTRRAPISIG